MRLVAVLMVLGAQSAFAQQAVAISLQAGADTAGLPRGCVAATVNALETWFRALSAGDTTLALSILSTEHGAFSVSGFAPTERWRGNTTRDLLAYVSQRGAQKERFTLQEVVLTGWLPKDVGCRSCSREILGFIPVFDRGSADRPQGKHRGMGKAGYQCGRGLWSLNMSGRIPGRT